jgi:hypothetical protein
MTEQTNIFEVDNTGRKVTRLGLSHDYEIVIQILEAAKRLYVSLGMYQIGIVDCEMKRLSAGDRATELTRLWSDTYISFESLGSLLKKWQPIDEAIESAIRAEVAAEKQQDAETKKLETMDGEFKRLMGDGQGSPKNDADGKEEQP